MERAYVEAQAPPAAGLILDLIKSSRKSARSQLDERKANLSIGEVAVVLVVLILHNRL
jgi:hypothetical protein